MPDSCTSPPELLVAGAKRTRASPEGDARVTGRHLGRSLRRLLPAFCPLAIALLAALACGQKDPVDINGPGNGNGNGPAAPGSLAVLANAAGAAIFVDGENTARATPDTLANVDAGVYAVTVALEGYTVSPESVTVTVAAESLSTVEFELTEIIVLSRVALVENFTNWRCEGCTDADEKLADLTQEFPSSRVVRITYHDIISGPDDPYYRANIEEANDRMGYYQVGFNPIVFVDGSRFDPTPFGWTTPESYTLLRTEVLSRLAVDPELAITVSDELDGNTYRVQAEVTAYTDFSTGGLILHFVVVETEIIPDEPGPQGQTEYLFVMRDMMPDAQGETLSINEGETLTFELETTVDPEWNTEHLAAVVFVQRDDAGREVLQAGGTY